MWYIILAMVFAVIIISVGLCCYHYGRYVSKETMKMFTTMLHENVLLKDKAAITDKILRKHYLATKDQMIQNNQKKFKDLKDFEAAAFNEVFAEHANKFKDIPEAHAPGVVQETFGKANQVERKN